MSQEELIEQLQRENEQLRQENAQLRAENRQFREQVEQLSRSLHELEGRGGKDSHNSSKPPSTDGYAQLDEEGARKRVARNREGKRVIEALHAVWSRLPMK